MSAMIANEKSLEAASFNEEVSKDIKKVADDMNSPTSPISQSSTTTEDSTSNKSQESIIVESFLASSENSGEASSRQNEVLKSNQKEDVPQKEFDGGSKVESQASDLLSMGMRIQRTVVDFVKTSFEGKESRMIAKFTTVTCAFLFLEFLYAILADSLSLLTDAGHMFCDMSALIVGLIVIYVKRVNQKKADKGWLIENIESISGLGNAIFLQSLALSIFFKSLRRFIKASSGNVELDMEHGLVTDGELLPLEKYNSEMIVVSIGGLILNLIGLYLFDEDGDAEEKNQNQYALFLHVLADTLGSVGALVAAFLVRTFQWYIADTICAFFTAITIFLSVVPLMKISYTNLRRNLYGEQEEQEESQKTVKKDL